MSFLALLVWPKTRPERRFSKHKHRLKQVTTEIKWSLSSCLIFSIVSSFGFFLVQNDWTLMYFELGPNDLIYFPASIVLSILLHDTYFFGAHLLMHRNRWLMKKVHSVHHQFRHPTPFSDICYHPIEAAIQISFFVLLVVVLPIHPAALAIYAFIINFSNIIGHTGFEFFDDKFLNGPLGRIINNPTDHLTHHINPNINFGLYFNFWDRWLEKRTKSKLSTSKKSIVTARFTIVHEQLVPNSESNVA